MPHLAPPRPRVPARLAAALLPVALLAACGGDKATGPGSGVTGSYALQSVNGQSLPMLLGQSDNYALYVASGSVDLRSDKSYAGSLTFRTTTNGQASSQSQQETGTYTVSGSTVTFRSSDGSSSTATVGGGRLTNSVPVEGSGTLTFVFQK